MTNSVTNPVTHAVRTKLVVADGRSALDWYARALGAHLGGVHEDGGHVQHADLVVLGTHLSLKDADDTDPVPVPGPILEVVVADPDRLEAALLDAGAESVFPVADQFYGARAGRVRDPYGVQWLLTTPVGD